MISCGMLYMLGNALGSSTTLALASSALIRSAAANKWRRSPIAYPLSYGVGSLLTGSTVEVAGYVGMFLALAALQSLGLIFALIQSQNLRSEPA